MAEQIKKVGITETVLRDAHQSLIATRMTTEDMLPIIDKMDKVGYHSVECWGGATFDACLRFLKEDPWERLRKLKDGFKNTKLQMLFRGQNILGYNHYSDDVVEYFVQKSIANGIDIIRIFDCLNDLRNLETAVKASYMHLEPTDSFGAARSSGHVRKRSFSCSRPAFKFFPSWLQLAQYWRCLFWPVRPWRPPIRTEIPFSSRTTATMTLWACVLYRGKTSASPGWISLRGMTKNWKSLQALRKYVSTSAFPCAPGQK